MEEETPVAVPLDVTILPGKQKEGFSPSFFVCAGSFYSSSGSGVCSDAPFPSVFLAFSFGIHL